MISETEQRSMARYRRAADYLALAMIYLQDNVLLRQPLKPEHLKPRLLGHWGTCPGITLVYAGLNRLIRDHDVNAMLVTGPGHGAPANHANLWLEGTHGEIDPSLSRNIDGMSSLVRQFSWPGGFPSHLSPQVPGVIHEGGELGYALATAFGAAYDCPDRMVACIVGDGEAETGPTAAAWHSSKYLSPEHDGAVLPILHVNGYKISSPTQSGTMTNGELTDLYRGYGWKPLLVDVCGPYAHEGADGKLAMALDEAYDMICALQQAARQSAGARRRAWPMIILRSPKGWGAPESLGTMPLAGTFHAHQVPLPSVHGDHQQFELLEKWLRSYRPEELFEEDGRPAPDLLALCPQGERRLGANPAANGGALRQRLPLPGLDSFAVDVPSPGSTFAEATNVLGNWLAALMENTEPLRNFRVFCPDELESNKLGGLLKATDRVYSWPIDEYAEHISSSGRVMEVLSEHNCQGWLQGYLLTGRHGLFPCYEAFAPIVDSMVNQYAKFLKISAEVSWRAPVASLNYLLTSEGWRQEHNGYSHQGPGFINNLLTKKSSATRLYFPCDANSLLVTMRHCLSSTDRINVVVAGKQSALQWATLEEAEEQFRAGASIWRWASSHDGEDPEVVLACAGNVPTVETLAAAWMLQRDVPELRFRVVNVLDLWCLAPSKRHPHGMDENEFRDCFGDNLPVVFNFHGYPSAVHECVHGRPMPDRFHVKGYAEEGTTTTPYDLLASNGVTRHDIACEVLRRAPHWSTVGGELAVEYRRERDQILARIRDQGIDPDSVTNWRWSE